MALFLIILAKLARSALKTAQREGKEFIFQLEVEGNFFLSLQMKEQHMLADTGSSFQFYLAYYKIGVAGEDTVLKTFCDGDFFTSINYIFYFNCILS